MKAVVSGLWVGFLVGKWSDMEGRRWTGRGHAVVTVRGSQEGGFERGLERGLARPEGKGPSWCDINGWSAWKKVPNDQQCPAAAAAAAAGSDTTAVGGDGKPRKKKKTYAMGTPDCIRSGHPIKGNVWKETNWIASLIYEMRLLHISFKFL